jgi:hypothetical protein
VRRRRHDVFGRECGLIRFVRAFQFGQGEPLNHDSSWRQPTHMLHPWPCLHARARNLEPEREPHGLGLRRRHCFTAAWWAAIATCACGRPQSWVSRLRKATCDVHMGSARRIGPFAFRIACAFVVDVGVQAASRVLAGAAGWRTPRPHVMVLAVTCGEIDRRAPNHFSFYGAKSWALAARAARWGWATAWPWAWRLGALAAAIASKPV